MFLGPVEEPKQAGLEWGNAWQRSGHHAADNVWLIECGHQEGLALNCVGCFGMLEPEPLLVD